MPLVTAAIRYGTVGLANTIVSILIIFAAKAWMGFGDLAANALGYSVGILLSFALNQRWTFRSRVAALPAFVRYLGVLLVAYLSNLIAVFAAIWIGVDDYVAHLFGIPPYALVGFVGARWLVFPDAHRTEVHESPLEGAK